MFSDDILTFYRLIIETTLNRLKNFKRNYENACTRILTEVCIEIKWILKSQLQIIPILDPVVSMFYVPDGEGLYTRGSSSQSIFLMGQSLFIIAQLLTAGLLHVNELDPIRRYLPSYNRPRKGGSRYSAFQVSYIQFIQSLGFKEPRKKEYM